MVDRHSRNQCSDDGVSLLMRFKQRAEKLPKSKIASFLTGRNGPLLEYALKLCSGRNQYLPLSAFQELATWLGAFVRTPMLRGSGLAATLVDNLSDVASSEARAWLNEQPKLSHVVRPSVEDILATGPVDGEKSAAFQAWRKRDAAAARAFLENPPARLTPLDRARLTQGLRIGLSAQDRDFLERENNQAVLRYLPDSKPWVELGEEVCRWLSVTGNALEVTFPDDFSDLFHFWGVSKMSVHPSLTPNQSWLYQLMERAPMKYLERRWSLVPSRILDLFVASDQGQFLLGAIHSSTVTYQDADWSRTLMRDYQRVAEALHLLIEAVGSAQVPNAGPMKAQDFATLLQNCPPEEREGYCEEIIDEKPNFTPALFDDAFEYLWSLPFTERQVVRAVSGPHGASAVQIQPDFQAQYAPLLWHSNSGVIDDLAKLIPYPTAEAQAARDDFGLGLRERDELRAAFSTRSGGDP